MLTRLCAVFLFIVNFASRADTVTQPLRTFSGETIQGVSLAPDSLNVATCGTNGVYICDVASLKRSQFLSETNVVGLVYSLDGKRLLTRYLDHPTCIWEVATTNLVRSLDTPATAAAFSKDGSKIVTGNYTATDPNNPADAKAIVWDAATGEKLATLEIGADSLNAVEFSSDGSRVMTQGDKVRIWETATGKLLQTIQGQIYVRGVAALSHMHATLSPDGTQVAIGEYNYTYVGPHNVVSVSECFSLWDADTGKMLRQFDYSTATVDGGPDMAVEAVAFSSDGTQVFASIFRKEGLAIKSWDTPTGNYLSQFGGYSYTSSSFWENIGYLAITPDGKQLVSVDWRKASAPNDEFLTDTTIKVWDVGTGKTTHTLSFTPRFGSAVLSGNGAKVVTAPSTYGPSSCWDAKTGELLSTALVEGQLTRLGTTADGSKSLLSFRNYVSLVDNATGAELNSFGNKNYYSDPVLAYLSKDGHRMIFWGPSTGETSLNGLWDVDTTNLLHSITTYGVFNISSNGDQALFAGSLKDTSTGNVITTFPLDINLVTSGVISADNSRVLTFSTDGKVRLWDAKSGQILFTFAGTFGALSTDGARVVVAGSAASRNASLWDGRTGELLRVMTGHASNVTSVDISNDGSKVLTLDGSVHLWDVSDLLPNLTIQILNGKPTVQWIRGVLQQSATADGQ